MVTILKLCIISGTHHYRSFSPNAELFPSSETEPKGPESHSRPRSHNNLPTAPMHVSRNHLAVTFPEPARPRQDPSSRRRAWERKEAPQHWEQVPGGSQAPCRGRGVIAECSRRGLPGGRGPGTRSRGAERGSFGARGQAEAAADTHSARTPDSPLPPPPYCSLPGRPRGLKPRDNRQERGRGGVCMGA